MASTRRCEVAPQRRRGDLAGERRAARAGQDDPKVGSRDEPAQERGGLVVGPAGDLAPGVGLLADLENRCAAVLSGRERRCGWSSGTSEWLGVARARVRAQGVADTVDHEGLRVGLELARADPLVLVAAGTD